jgi:hypothetical protein
MKGPASIQYTIRGVPGEVDRALRDKARRGKKSLNQVVIEELAASTHQKPVRIDLSDVVGKWTSDPAFDEVIASQRKIDLKKWK